MVTLAARGGTRRAVRLAHRGEGPIDGSVNAKRKLGQTVANLALALAWVTRPTGLLLCLTATA
jgi:hypothetical protein